MDDIKPPESAQPNDPGPAQANDDHSIPPEDLDMYLPPSQRKKPRWHKVLGIIILLIIIAAAVLAGVYWFFLRADNAAPATPTVTAPPKTTRPKKVSLAHYDSDNFGLSFDYPETWKVNDNTKLLTVTSPVVKLIDANGDEQSGKLIVSVQPKGTTPQPLAKADAVAVLESQKISYDDPSGVQNAATYLSYLQYASTTIHGGLNAVYVTGGLGYKYSQNIPASDIKGLDPLVTITFEQCGDAKCSATTPLTLSSSSWQGSDPQKTIQAILKSVRIDT